VLRGTAGEEHAALVRRWFQESAEAGDQMEAYNLAVCLAQGIGGARDDQAAAQWLRRSAETVLAAQQLYGQWLLEGRGVAQDPAEAREWIARAADSGDLEAQVTLADLVVTGTGGPRDPVRALTLYEQAALRGHVGAMFALVHHGGGTRACVGPTDVGTLPRARGGRRSGSRIRSTVVAGSGRPGVSRGGSRVRGLGDRHGRWDMKIATTLFRRFHQLNFLPWHCTCVTGSRPTKRFFGSGDSKVEKELTDLTLVRMGHLSLAKQLMSQALAITVRTLGASVLAM
jgi:TPR repeat protein